MGQQEATISEQQSDRRPSGYLRGAPSAIIAKFTDRGFQKQAVWVTFSVILALLVSAVIMAMAGYDAGTAFTYLLVGAIREPDRVVQFATPLILTGLSVALAFKCGLFNIGAEGQLYVGSMAAAVVGYAMAFPYLIHPILCFMVAAVFGALYAFVPGLLKAYRGAHEVVTTMMLSYAAILITSWLVGPYGPFFDSAGSQLIPQTPLLQDTAILPTIGGHYMHAGILVSLLAVIGVDFLVNRTVLGYEMRAVGENESAADYAGINSKRRVTVALTISGGLAGVAGGGEIMGTYGRFIHDWSPGLGWDGITVAVLGSNNPWGVLAGAIFFAALKVGGNSMQQSAHVPIEMVGVIQGLVVLFVAAPRIIEWIQTQSFDYTSWARSEESFPVEHFVGTSLSIGGIFVSFGLLATMGRTFLVDGTLFTIAMITLAAFGSFLSRSRNIDLLMTLSIIGWFAAFLAGFLAGEFLVWILSGIFGVLCLFDLVLIRRAERTYYIKQEVPE
ncbi:MAG: ABC transporter permease [Promethearchaeota archaeon]